MRLILCAFLNLFLSHHLTISVRAFRRSHKNDPGTGDAPLTPHRREQEGNVDLDIAVSAALSKEDYESTKAAVKYNVKQMFRSSITNGDAFYFPQRMITALIMSTIVLILACIFIYRYAESYRNTVCACLCATSPCLYTALFLRHWLYATFSPGFTLRQLEGLQSRQQLKCVSSITSQPVRTQLNDLFVHVIQIRTDITSKPLASLFTAGIQIQNAFEQLGGTFNANDLSFIETQVIILAQYMCSVRQMVYSVTVCTQQMMCNLGECVVFALVFA